MRSLRWGVVAATLAGIFGCGALPGGSPGAALQASARAGAAALAQSLAAANPGLDPAALAHSDESASVIAVPTAPMQPPTGATTGNSAQLFVSPDETLPAVLGEVDAAKKSIYLETFNFGTTYAQRLAPHLIAKAQAGVEVRLLIDYAGSRFLRGFDGLVAQLRKGGVDVEVYKPYRFTDPTHRQSFNIIHRKVYLFDGERALVGGVNLASPFDTTTQDLLIRWQGPVLAPLYQEFTHDWQHVSKTALGAQPVTAPQGDVDAQVLVTSPGEGRYEIRDAVFQRIDAAARTIEIENQYLWDDQIVAHLASAAGRGVKVRVLLPGPEQKSVQRTCNYLTLNKLVKLGVEARLYHGVVASAHLHTKYYAVDGSWVATGSCNGDTRSLDDNQELDIATTHPALIQQLDERLFERDWTSFSQAYTPTQPGFIVKPFDNLLDLIDYYM